MKFKTNFTPFGLLLVFISIYASIVTSFNSSLVFTIPLILFIQYCFSQHEFVSIKPLYFWTGLVLSTSFFTGVFFSGYWGTGNDFVLLTGDLQFYSRASEFLNNKGIETIDLDYFNDGLIENPYHYTELWLTAIIARISSFHYDVSFVLAMWGVIWGFVYYNLVVLVKLIFRRESVMVYILPFLLPFIGVFAFIYPDSISVLSQDIWDVPLVRYGKHLLITMGVLPGLYLIIKKDYLGSIACLGLTGVFYFPVLASFLLFGGVLFLILLYKGEIKFSTKKVWFFLGAMLLSIGGFVMFYAMANTGETNSSIGHSNLDFSHIQFSLYVRTILNIIIKTSLGVIITTLPYFVIFYLLRKRKGLNSFNIYLFLIFYSCCLLVWGFLHILTDSVQLYANAFFPVLHLLVFIGIAYLATINLKTGSLIALILLLISFGTKKFEYKSNVEIISIGEASQIGDFIDVTPNSFKRSNNDIVYAYRKDWDEVKTFFALKTVVFPPMNILRLFGSYRPICVNIGEMSISDDENTRNDEMAIKSSAPFMKLLKAKKDIETIYEMDVFNNSSILLLSNTEIITKIPTVEEDFRNERIYKY